MKNDILPPKSLLPETRSEETALSDEKSETPQALPQTTTPPELRTPKRPRSSFKLLAILSLVFFLIIAAASFTWLLAMLQPVDPDNLNRERIIVENGSSLSTVGTLLDEKNLIRNRSAFMLYAKFMGAGSRLQAGTYSLSPSESVSQIITHFTSGAVDQFSLTFLPGSTLRRLPGETSTAAADIKSALIKAGYEDSEVETAFSRTYDHPLFVGKPDGADLEGYIYGETYKFSGSTDVEQILETTFDQYYKVIEENNLLEGFKAQGLSLFEAITLASIIQREEPVPANQKQVAQVFLTRFRRGISLGSDVTYQYAAKKDGVPPTPELDSPYNTRKFTGLPPGPISTPGLSALQAVASPAEGDFLFFLSGDDNKTYFAYTIEEHEANIINHCRQKCSEY